MGHAEADCKTVLEKLYLYLDREVGSVTYAEIEAHLVRCRPCHERVEFEREVKATIGRKCQEHLPPEIVERLRSRLREILG
jgi:mycothiol system anti-sigma-R factor